jgi:hypothetical protein
MGLILCYIFFDGFLFHPESNIFLFSIGKTICLVISSMKYLISEETTRILSKRMEYHQWENERKF